MILLGGFINFIMFDILLSGIPELLPHFETAHLTALLFTFILGFIIIISTKVKSSNQFTGIVSAVLAIFLITCYPAKIISRTLDGIPLDKDSMFPLHLCDVAAVAGFFALVFKNRLCAEITYFFGLAATLQALFTPSTCYNFPSFSFFAFFQLHSIVVIVAIYLPLVLNWRPRKGAVIRVWICGLIYVLIAGTFDWITGANYGFFRYKAEGSLMDVLHDWPFYIIEMTLLALIFFLILALPFVGKKRQKAN